MELVPIGFIETPFLNSSGVPIQPSASEAKGVVHVAEPYRDALQDVAGFERIWLLYWCDRAAPPQMLVTPYLHGPVRGLFATRALSRPNPLGLSSVRLDGVDGLRLYVSQVDILHGTPLLDIKPYVAGFDAFPTQRNGWLDAVGVAAIKQGRSDQRFQNQGTGEKE